LVDFIKVIYTRPMEFNKEEVAVIGMALVALEGTARSDEPHIAHSGEFRALQKKVLDFLKTT
jgi:hypothetical protein